MIIAFDGNVFAGKTSLIGGLNISGECDIVPEHGKFLEDISPQENAWSIQKKYLDAEKRRHEYLTNLSQNKPILLDRSFVSMAAHVVALRASRGIDMREQFLHELIRDINSGNVVIPDKFFFIQCDNEVIKMRASGDTVKNTDKLYFEKIYLEAVGDFNRQWQRLFPGLVIDTTDGKSVQLSQLIVIKELFADTAPGYDTNDICRSLGDLLT